MNRLSCLLLVAIRFLLANDIQSVQTPITPQLSEELSRTSSESFIRINIVMKEQINSDGHNITVEDNTSITNTQNSDDSIESKEKEYNDIEGVIECHSLESIQMVKWTPSQGQFFS